MNRPNILLIHSDQHRFDCVGANGHPLVQTPNIDRLAREGMRFTHAFCPIPLCTPARASLMSGQWPAKHLSIANWDTEAPRPMKDTETFAERLNQGGYRLGYVGKWHVDPERSPLEFGFHDYISDDEYGEWRVDRGFTNNRKQFGWLGGKDMEIGPEDSRLAWGANRVLELLEQYDDGQMPFFLRWDPTEPHLPNIVPEPYASMYDPDYIEPWPGFADPLANKPYIQGQQKRTWKVDHWTWEDWAPIVSRYLGDITLLDAQIGRILQFLDERGLTDNTLVIYTTDHGDMCGSHGMLDKHFIMYDDVIRVPMVARWPGKIAPASVSTEFIAHSVDLAATFCDAAGLEIPDSFQGTSLLPLFGGEGSWPRKDIFAVYHGNQFGLFSQRVVRDRRWKYVWNVTAEDELYDLETDPGEITNLALDPRYANELRRLRVRLVNWMEETEDRLLNMWTRPQILEGLTR